MSLKLRNILVLHCALPGSAHADPRYPEKLAGKGSSFPSTSSTTPNPEAARMSLMSGLLPHQQNRPGSVLMGELFAASGFLCVHRGDGGATRSLKGFHRTAVDSSPSLSEFIRQDHAKPFLYFVEIGDRDSETAVQQAAEILEDLANGPNAADTLIALTASPGLPADPGDGFRHETINVPLIFSGPGTGKTGRRFGNVLASTADFLPTLCNLSGFRAPVNIFGKDLTPVLMSQTPVFPNIRDAAPAESGAPEGRMIRSFSYKYAHYCAAGREDLFRLKPDPSEKENLAEQRGYLDTLIYHRRLMKKHLDETRDPYPFPFTRFSQ